MEEEHGGFPPRCCAHASESIRAALGGRPGRSGDAVCASLIGCGFLPLLIASWLRLAAKTHRELLFSMCVFEDSLTNSALRGGTASVRRFISHFQMQSLRISFSNFTA